MILDDLITDRTQEDVQRARAIQGRSWRDMTQAERDALRGGLKGAYGPTDLDRVVAAMEHIDRLMREAKRESVYAPVLIDHAAYAGQWDRWSDTTWVDSDYLTPALWAALLADMDRFWAAARRFRAIVPARYDPDGNGYIPLAAELDAGKLFTVTDSFGLLALRVTAHAPPGVTAEGGAWTITQTADGWTAELEYPTGPYSDIGNALGALKLRCGSEDQIVDGAFTLSATLRYDYDVTAGTCAVRWSPFQLWGEARELYKTWGGAKPLAWGQAARGEEP